MASDGHAFMHTSIAAQASPADVSLATSDPLILSSSSSAPQQPSHDLRQAFSSRFPTMGSIPSQQQDDLKSCHDQLRPWLNERSQLACHAKQSPVKHSPCLGLSGQLVARQHAAACVPDSMW